MFFTYAFVNMGMVSGSFPWSACRCRFLLWGHGVAHPVHRRRHPHERCNGIGISSRLILPEAAIFEKSYTAS